MLPTAQKNLSKPWQAIVARQAQKSSWSVRIYRPGWGKVGKGVNTQGQLEKKTKNKTHKGELAQGKSGPEGLHTTYRKLGFKLG